jgi:hypothetical protein
MKKIIKNSDVTFFAAFFFVEFVSLALLSSMLFWLFDIILKK